jgi:nucleoside phosphorylase
MINRVVPLETPPLPATPARRHVGRPIATYYSHSYRADDREVNLYLHGLFWANGFAFTVDPWSERVAHAQLEHMMNRSACFVAVAVHRPEVPRYRTSPFVVDEYGLAVQAQKPRLVFVESGVAGRFFEADRVCVFRRDSLFPDGRRQDVRRAIERLRAESGPHVNVTDRTLGSVGLVLPRTGVYERARTPIQDLLQKAGYEVCDVRYDHPNSYQLVMEVDRHDFIVIDVGARGIPGWLHPLLAGRFVPMIRLAHGRRVRDADALLEPVRGGHAFELVANRHELVMPWSTVTELVDHLEAEVDQLQVPRRQFRSLEEGQMYFRSLGRTRHGPVFVSNAGPENDLARDLSRHLDINNITFFQYRYRNTIEIGADWTERLRDKLAASVLFVPLVTRSYWDSEWCRKELEIASELRARGAGPTILPYFLEDPAICGGSLATMQGRLLGDLRRDEQIAQIVSDVDEWLTEPSSSPAVVTRSWYQEPEPQVDIALITVLPEEYRAVLGHLERHHGAAGTTRHPNRYSWEFGEISSFSQRTYRVVLGMAGNQGTSGDLLIVRETIEAFHPTYVLLVGIAGGLERLRRGDVVVSSCVYGYEYGEVDTGFRPRPHWVYHTDSAITTAAATMEVRHPRWYEALNRAPLSPPRIHVGPVASGNKVVDDLSEPTFQPVLQFWPGLVAVEMDGLGAAEAIHEANERGHAVNFAMLRGISDTRRLAARSARRSRQTAQRDRWKLAAAEAAAELAIQLIRRAWPNPPRF